MGVQNHRVRLIGQDDLPAGKDWALVEVEGRIVAFLTPAALTEQGLEEAWAAYRLLATPKPPKPRPVRPSWGQALSLAV